MKRLTLLAAAIIGLCSCSSNKYVIKGEIEGLSGMIYLADAAGMESNTPLDSVRVEEGKFRFEGTAAMPDMVYIHNGSQQAIPFFTEVFAEPGTITLKGSLENPTSITATGTPSNDANAAFKQQFAQLIERYYAPETTDEDRTEIEEEADEMTREAVEENKNNYFGVMLFTSQMTYDMSGKEIIEAIESFPAELQRTKLLTKARENAEARMRTEIGQPYIDIVQNNPDGQPVSLKSVIETEGNRYVLIDFWASWCRPCMGEVPYLLATYEKYHSKGFEIYGVSFDSGRDEWVAAIEKKGMNWIHVSDVARFDNQAARDYAVQGIPSNFLIDCATGKIVASNLRGEELEAKIAELLQ